jgi:maltooligosyltrehalose trehalohydrolase
MKSDQSSQRVSRAPGAHLLPGGRCLFRVWSPDAEEVLLHLIRDGEVDDRAMEPSGSGVWELIVDQVVPGQRYLFSAGGDFFPDPASRFQPDGVHEPSAVIDVSYDWTDHSWRGTPREDLVLYEIHVGTFTREGTFRAVTGHLDRLRDLGITAIELMPVAQFAGERNWGYDGACPWAVQNSYGGPAELQRLVDACHRRGLAIILDVVYNHLGPEGNYLTQFGPYFTDRYLTPWGDAINFDGEWSDGVRRYFIENALYWLDEMHFDGLRLDAVHAIPDASACHFLRELASEVRSLESRLGRRLHLIAESDLNDPVLLRSPEVGGYGLDAQWSDDFHHALHAFLTGEREGYYADFGEVWHLEKALRDIFVYDGRHSPHRKRRHGAPACGLDGSRFVIATQNHDQVGNRMKGERSSVLLSFEELKLSAGLLLLSPHIPLIFMGEEVAEESPFLYFTSHSDPDLVEAVREGRKREFATFAWKGEPPDPQHESTLASSTVDHGRAESGRGAIMHTFYRELLILRNRYAEIRDFDRRSISVRRLGERLDVVRYDELDPSLVISYNLSKQPVERPLDLLGERSSVVFSSSESRWMENDDDESDDGLLLAPRSFTMFTLRERNSDLESRLNR